MKKLFITQKWLSFLLAAVLLFCLPIYGAEADTEAPRYGYQTITESNVQYVYKRLATELLKPEPPESIELPESKAITKEQLQKAYHLFSSDHPECFWVRGYSYSYKGEIAVAITPNYAFAGDALLDARIAVSEAVEELLLDLPSTDNYDKALYLHDRLAKWVTYEEVGEHQTVYGALVAKKAVCAGYAAAYQLLLQSAGIDAWTVTGSSQKPGEPSIPHAWNMVWIEEDVCVYTDVTWDDGDGELFHAYFNISRDEMAKDHAVDTALFTLPACTHTNQSYFDINDCSVEDNIPITELAKLFGPAENGVRKAVLYYEGTDINRFLSYISDNRLQLPSALSCGVGNCSYQISHMGNEIHMEVAGNFPPMTYLVELTLPNSIVAYEGASQYVVIGEALKPITLHAAKGYYFPESYILEALRGIGVTRISATELSVWGTPTQSMSISLPPAKAMEKEEQPQAVYTPTELGCGKLSGVDAGMKYSLDGLFWIEIRSDEELLLTGLTGSKLYVIRGGNGESTMDSDKQILTVSNPMPPATEEPGSTPDATEPNANGSADSAPALFGCSSLLAPGSAALLLTALIACGVTKKRKK